MSETMHVAFGALIGLCLFGCVVWVGEKLNEKLERKKRGK